jgi:threonine/homoserine/homoserine lactone efflux protein
MLWLGGTFMAIALVTFAVYGVFAVSVRQHVINRPRVTTRIRRTFKVSFLALGARLALTPR